MKEFKLLVGLTEDHMTEVLVGTLKNDSVPETLHVPNTSQNGIPFPTRYVKIISLSCVAITCSRLPLTNSMQSARS